MNNTILNSEVNQFLESEGKFDFIHALRNLTDADLALIHQTYFNHQDEKRPVVFGSDGTAIALYCNGGYPPSKEVTDKCWTFTICGDLSKHFTPKQFKDLHPYTERELSTITDDYKQFTLLEYAQIMKWWKRFKFAPSFVDAEMFFAANFVMSDMIDSNRAIHARDIFDNPGLLNDLSEFDKWSNEHLSKFNLRHSWNRFCMEWLNRSGHYSACDWYHRFMELNDPDEKILDESELEDFCSVMAVGCDPLLAPTLTIEEKQLYKNGPIFAEALAVYKQMMRWWKWAKAHPLSIKKRELFGLTYLATAFVESGDHRLLEDIHPTALRDTINFTDFTYSIFKERNLEGEFEEFHAAANIKRAWYKVVMNWGTTAPAEDGFSPAITIEDRMSSDDWRSLVA